MLTENCVSVFFFSLSTVFAMELKSVGVIVQYIYIYTVIHICTYTYANKL